MRLKTRLRNLEDLQRRPERRLAGAIGIYDPETGEIVRMVPMRLGGPTQPIVLWLPAKGSLDSDVAG